LSGARVSDQGMNFRALADDRDILEVSVPGLDSL
jgi:hypothetical protein